MIKYSDFLEKIQKKETTCVDFTREILYRKFQEATSLDTQGVNRPHL